MSRRPGNEELPISASASTGLTGDTPSQSLDAPAEATTAFKLERNSLVQMWIEYFTVKDRERFERFLLRGRKYRKVVEDVLIENDLPPELHYLALIESGYQNHAISSAKAVGVWQFMPATGKQYGLQVDSQVDERRDPIRSTEAAAKYLRDLYNIFGSWPLAIAGYNAGEYRVIGSIVKSKSRDFWTLASLNALPRETQDYVPKIIAAAIIGANPKEYGFNFDENVELYPDLEAIEVASPVLISDLARVSGVSVSEIRDVNPHLKSDRTPANLRTYEVWFPQDKADAVKSLLPRIAALRLKTRAPQRIVASNSENKNHYRVKRGDNLSAIARKHGTTVSYLKRVNELRSGRIVPGMRLRVTSSSYHPKSSVRHRVRSGENLEKIARKFRTTVSRIKSDNSLRNERIMAGQLLIIRK